MLLSPVGIRRKHIRINYDKGWVPEISAKVADACPFYSRRYEPMGCCVVLDQRCSTCIVYRQTESTTPIKDPCADSLPSHLHSASSKRDMHLLESRRSLALVKRRDVGKLATDFAVAKMVGRKNQNHAKSTVSLGDRPTIGHFAPNGIITPRTKGTDRKAFLRYLLVQH